MSNVITIPDGVDVAKIQQLIDELTPKPSMGEIKTPELLNCPFCDGKAQWATGTHKTEFGLESVYCQYCMAQTAPEDLIKDAAARWNTRPATARPLQALKRCEVGVTALLGRNEVLEQRLTELDKWRVALESLTAQGSEFHNDLDACVDYIHKQRTYQHNGIKAAVKERKKLERENQALEQRLAVVTEALQDYGNPDNWNYSDETYDFSSYRLTDRDGKSHVFGVKALAESDRIAQTEIK